MPYIVGLICDFRYKKKNGSFSINNYGNTYHNQDSVVKFLDIVTCTYLLVYMITYLLTFLDLKRRKYLASFNCGYARYC